MLRRAVGAVIAALAVASSADAGDLAGRAGSIKDAPAAYGSSLWEGFYIGANAGYAWAGNNGGNIEVFDGNGKPYATGPLNYDLSLEGGFAGLQVGFNRRAGNFVFGLEADIQTRVDGGSKTSFDPPAIFNFDYTAALDVAWFGTLRGRVGYARDRTLIYATGGLAFGEVNYSARYLITEPCCSGGFANLKSSGVETGYVVGGGLEHAINPNWSLKLEYQYINLGSGKAEAPLFFANGSPSGEKVKANFDTDFHTVRLGLNYRFQREPEPLK
jgi:outer membrane immunogenic protein